MATLNCTKRKIPETEEQEPEPEPDLLDSIVSKLSIVGLNSAKRRKASEEERDWSRLLPDLLELIMSNLSLIDIIDGFAGVCSDWCSAAKSYVSSLRYTPCPQLPWLLVPNDVDDEFVIFFNTEENKPYTMKKTESITIDDSCIGSPINWLRIVYAKTYFFKKAVVLSSYESCITNHTYISAAVIYGCKYNRKKLSFCTNGDHSELTTINSTCEGYYSDIIYHNGMLYALTSDLSVQAWDFQGLVPVKRMSIKPKGGFEKTGTGYRENYYLAESSGKLLLVVRYIQNFVPPEGEEAVMLEFLTAKYWQPAMWPYRTVFFHVFELDFCQERWVHTKTLGNRVLFLGRSHSLSLSTEEFAGWEGDAIHFIDDHKGYRGCDTGVFSLRHGAVNHIFDTTNQ
ncbi:F-box protein [Tripterygium wilfordii]|uniref:F-box protein n=1 Tax=Tripterygium wilfordii TaxID=458696 RepID=A0A7J7CRL3_TRIWF|nr:uncharacterized protein LOC120015661 [Tripterygium wilfordii]KAF5736694.1 F-box protein [Tripterygium wilfordii]